MSVITQSKNAEISATARRDEDATITSAMLTLFRYLRKAIVGTALVVVWIAEAFAEVRQQRANFELEFYRNRYRHSSKNDDDLPMVR